MDQLHVTTLQDKLRKAKTGEKRHKFRSKSDFSFYS